MKFIIISKKEKFNPDIINETLLLSCNAPSLISKECLKKEIANFDIYLYTYNQITEEKKDLFYKFDSNEVKFFNGLISAENINTRLGIDNIFETLENNELIFGDYQLFYLNDKGNGFIKTPQASIYPLFYYEDECCCVVSNELKLIVDGVESFSDSFVNYYDAGYLHEIYHKGFFTKKRDCIRDTAFRNIKRILPHDEITFENGSVDIKENEDIEIPAWFEEWYLEDKESLYDWYYDKLTDYADSMLDSISKNVNTITLGLSGGYDSRLTLIILEKLCKKHGISLETYTTGLSDHPDVIIANRISQAMDVKWENISYSNENNLKPLPKHLRQYASTFYESQGDFDSHDFVTQYSRQIENTDYFNQSGMDLYKRDTLSTIINFNRWYSRRTLFKTNFYFPLFGTNLELWFALIYKKHFPKKDYYTEFVYNVIKRGNPELLDIPFALKSLPQLDIAPFKSENYTTTFHDPEPFLWDYEFVLTELAPILKTAFDEKNNEFDSILSESGLNPLDYFLLDKNINSILKKYTPEDFEKIKSKLISLKGNSFYPKCRTLLKIELDEKNYMKKRSLMKLMDYASAAGFDSFESVEHYFTSKGYDSKEEAYIKMDSLSKSNLELTEEKEKLSKQNNELKNEINDLLSSNSWKITKPIRKIKKIRK